MASITPFKIAIPNEKLLHLQQKLSLTILPPSIDDSNWSLGPPVSEIKRLVHHWQHTFSWRDAEANLNTFPQFITKIPIDGFDTYNVHFLHQRSTTDVGDERKVIPLLFVHGWPGSFVEVTKMLPLLLEGDVGKTDGIVFDVVAPSLINFGFSEGNTKKDFQIDQQAEACHKLMLALGYTEYIVQGGDIGSLVARFIARKYGPKYCKAHHIIGSAPGEPTATSHPELHAKIATTPLSPLELAGLGRSGYFAKQGMGYYHLQSTRPLTLGYALNDSPVALLAWIYEKLHDWSDDYPWTDDEILTWVCIYYFSTAGPSASSNIFYSNEHRSPTAFEATQQYIPDVPLGISRFPKELILLPKLWNQTLGQVVWDGDECESGGGHFGAWERPEKVVGDLRGLVGRIKWGL